MQIGLIINVHVTQQFWDAGSLEVKTELEDIISGIGNTVVMKYVEYLP